MSGASVLLHGPGVAVGVVEEEVAGAGGAFGAELLDVADGDAAAGQGLADGVDVGDDELDALDRAGVAEGQALADDDRAGRRCEKRCDRSRPVARFRKREVCRDPLR